MDSGLISHFLGRQEYFKGNGVTYPHPPQLALQLESHWPLFHSSLRSQLQPQEPLPQLLPLPATLSLDHYMVSLPVTQTSSLNTLLRAAPHGLSLFHPPFSPGCLVEYSLWFSLLSTSG